MDVEISDIQEKIERKLAQMNQISNDVDCLANSLKDKVIENRKTFKNEVPYMIRKIMQYIGHGDTEINALLLVSQEFDYPLHNLISVWKSAKQQKKAINLYAKAFTAQKMTDKGYTHKEIAEVIGISTKSVQRLLKCETRV